MRQGTREVNVLNLVGSRLHLPVNLEAAAQVLFELTDPRPLPEAFLVLTRPVRNTAESEMVKARSSTCIHLPHLLSPNYGYHRG